MVRNRDSTLMVWGSADPAPAGALQHKPLISIDNFTFPRSGELTEDTAIYCEVISPLSPPQYQNSMLGADRRPGRRAMEKMMSHENTERPRSLVAELVRRRNRIAKAKRSFEVLMGAYDLVAADLRAAASGESDPATCGETTTTA